MPLLPRHEPFCPANTPLERVISKESIPATVTGLNSVQAVSMLNITNPKLSIQLIAGWLSTREAIWWAVLCQSQLLKVGKGTQHDTETVSKVTQWVLEPGDSKRESIAPRGETTPASSIGLLTSAVSLTADNLSPSKDHPVNSNPTLAHRLTAQSIITAASPWGSESPRACYLHFINIGLDITEGLNLWRSGAIPPHPGLRHTAIKNKGKSEISSNIWEKWGKENT